MTKKVTKKSKDSGKKKKKEEETEEEEDDGVPPEHKEGRFSNFPIRQSTIDKLTGKLSYNNSQQEKVLNFMLAQTFHRTSTIFISILLVSPQSCLLNSVPL